MKFIIWFFFFLLSFQISNILSIDRPKLDEACDALNLEPFDSKEYDFLNQYFRVINKVAIALKTLKADKYTFGLYLPTLFGLRSVLEKISNPTTTEMFECLPLAKALKTGFENRFGKLMDAFESDGKSAPLFIAMVSNPQFKLNFLGTRVISSHMLQHLKEMLVVAALQIEKTNLTESVPCEQIDNIASTSHGHEHSK